jgi:glycosyl hydrolase family 123
MRFLAAALACLVLSSNSLAVGIKREPCVLFDASYGELLSKQDGVSLWWASSGWKIDRNRPVPTRKGKAVELRTARNEAEAVQFVLHSSKAGTVSRVQASDLMGPDGARISADQVNVREVGYVNITNPTDRSSTKALWPDPLFPLDSPVALRSGENQPFWVVVNVPRDATAGLYEGVISVEGAGLSIEVPLRVVVYDFELPDSMTCTTAFGISPTTIFKYHNVTGEEQQRAVLEKYWESFGAHHISPYHPCPLAPWLISWEKRDASNEKDLSSEETALLKEHALTPVFDWSAWDRELTRVMDLYGFNTFRLKPLGMRGNPPSIAGFAEGTPEYTLALKAYLGEMNRHFKEKGLLEEAFFYWIDEPQPPRFPIVMNGCKKLSTYAPDVTSMVTVDARPELFGGPDLWCPLPRAQDFDVMEERRAAGDRFWWYVCTGPKTPYPGLFTDHPGTDLRVWLWQTWKYNFEGILIWQTNSWHSRTAYPDGPQDPLKDPMTWKSGYGLKPGMRAPFGNGDGRFLYPPQGATGKQSNPVMEGPIESIRWEILRDALEDFEYLAVLRRLLEEKESDLSKREKRRVQALLEVPDAITSEVTVYTKDPAPIEKQRDRIARAIEELSRK